MPAFSFPLQLHFVAYGRVFCLNANAARIQIQNQIRFRFRSRCRCRNRSQPIDDADAVRCCCLRWFLVNETTLDWGAGATATATATTLSPSSALVVVAVALAVGIYFWSFVYRFTPSPSLFFALVLALNYADLIHNYLLVHFYCILTSAGWMCRILWSALWVIAASSCGSQSLATVYTNAKL